MKKLFAITTSLIAAVGAIGLGGGAVAFAETENGSQYYPTEFETAPSFSNLQDYAVGNGEILFLENNKISKYGGERVVTYANPQDPVQRLYFEGGEFYYGTDDGKTYALKNFYDKQNTEIADFTSTTETEDILLSNKYNYFINNGDYYFLDKNTPSEPSVLLTGYTNLKRYGETVYAVKENVLYTLNGTEGTVVKVKNFDITKDIKVGNAYTELKASAEQDPQFVRLTNGAYMTEVDLDKLTENSEYFIENEDGEDTGTAGKTVQVNTGETPTALLLYTAGNKDAGISVIAVNGKTYLIHPKDTAAKTVHPYKDSEFTEGTATEGFIYSAPYESKGTRITNLPYGTTLKILKEIKKADNAELDHDFYYVEYKVDEETTVKGYVRFGLLSTYTFNEAPPTETPDPEETYEDLIKPVVLILLVILLIAIAAGYLIYVGTSDKRKKKAEAAATDTTKQDKK